MAKQNTPQIRAQKETQIVIKDLTGQTILSVGLLEYTIKNSNGAIIKKNTNESILLVSGELWHPGLKDLPIGVCPECRRKKKSHGIMSLRMARMCVDCGGKLLCASCRKLGKDRKWRCYKHHRRHLIKKALRPIFFKTEEISCQQDKNY